MKRWVVKRDCRSLEESTQNWIFDEQQRTRDSLHAGEREIYIRFLEANSFNTKSTIPDGTHTILFIIRIP